MCCVPDCEKDAMEASTPSLPMIFTRPSLVPTCAQSEVAHRHICRVLSGRAGVVGLQRQRNVHCLAVSAKMVLEHQTAASQHAVLVLMQQQRPVCHVVTS